MLTRICKDCERTDTHWHKNSRNDPGVRLEWKTKSAEEKMQSYKGEKRKMEAIVGMTEYGEGKKKVYTTFANYHKQVKLEADKVKNDHVRTSLLPDDDPQACIHHRRL